ncbi:MAG: aminotransferase class V-fold PLP-dependent enzyme [Marinicaulis sp.]|nr:aminotransferase class V-fold PLP-dependent enzyme [Marinicaulis sp.]
MIRDKFHLDGRCYFLSHSVGAKPKSYENLFAAGFEDPWRSSGADVWDDWFGTLAKFREQLAPMIGADANDICPQSNVSSGLTKILCSLPERPGRKRIVLSEDDFPTVGFVLAQAERMGYELEFLPGGESLADIETWREALNEDVHLVLATHVYSNSSVRAPCREIAQLARAHEVYSVLDVAQSVGAVPIYLNKWQPDFAVGTSLKYLCGGPGAAFLWARQETAQESRPRDVGWFSHARPFEMDIRNFEYAQGADRFTGGTPSIAPFAGAIAGLEIFNEVGAEKIFAHNQALLNRLKDGLPDAALLSTQDRSACGSGAMINVKDYKTAAIALADAKIAHDTRLGAVRLSVHFYNSEEDIDRLLNAIAPHL